MDVTVTNEGNMSILSLTGSLDTNTSKGAENQMNKLIEEGRIKLLIDLSNLDYISSSGLRILLSTSKKLKPIGGEMRISGLNETVNEVFEISGFTMIFNVFKTLEEAKTNF